MEKIRDQSARYYPTRAQGKKPFAQLCAEFPVETCQAFALSIVTMGKRTAATSEKALMAAYPSCRKWPQFRRQGVADLLEQRPETIQALAQLQTAAMAKDLLSMQEKRSMLATIARTPLSDVADSMGQVKPDLTDEQKLVVRKLKSKSRTKDGETETDSEIETYNRLDAIRLDSELTGELGRSRALVQVNIGQTLKDLPIETRVNAILLADSTCLLD